MNPCNIHEIADICSHVQMLTYYYIDEFIIDKRINFLSD